MKIAVLKYILIISLFLGLTSQAYAAVNYKEACENLKINPEVVFYTSYGKLQYNMTYTKDELSELGCSIGMFESGDLASGLAMVDIASEYELSTGSRSMSNNAYCIIPQELTVYIGFQNPIIYLAKDMQKDTCLYNLVVRHEQIHQQINVNALEYFIPLIYQKVKDIAANMRPMYVSSEIHIRSGTNDMTAFYAKKINALVEEFREAVLEEQRKLDNRRQYRLESNICQNYNKRH